MKCDLCVAIEYVYGCRWSYAVVGEALPAVVALLMRETNMTIMRPKMISNVISQ